MKRSLLLLAFAAAATPGAALAGWRSPHPVVIDTLNRVATGGLGTVYNSTDTVSYIGCSVIASLAGDEVFCSARDTLGRTVSCQANSPYLVNAARSITSSSLVEFWWSTGGGCEKIQIENGSYLEPKK